MTVKPMPDSNYWRLRAEEARTTAETMRDKTCRETMERLAQQYENMAACADRRANKAEDAA